MRYLDNVNQSITERRDIVIETAFKLFAENRIEPVTMTVVANNCNMGVASIYRYFLCINQYICLYKIPTPVQPSFFLHLIHYNVFVIRHNTLSTF